MANFRAEKVLALPGTLAANTIYLMTDVNADLLQIHVSNSTGTASRHVPTMAEINSAITDAIGGSNGINVVQNITERDSLDPALSSKMVLVVDATDDDTVVAGAATYVYNPATTNWIKIAEHESLDVTLEWASIQNGPTSSVAAIDAAVTASHSHTNKATLDLLSASGGDLYYNSVAVGTNFATVAW